MKYPELIKQNTMANLSNIFTQSVFIASWILLLLVYDNVSVRTHTSVSIDLPGRNSWNCYSKCFLNVLSILP